MGYPTDQDFEEARRHRAPPSKEMERTKLMGLNAFSELNARRCEKGFGRRVDEWSTSDWMTALVGEVGELANIIKKRDLRGESIPADDFAKEWADCFMYLNLLGQRLGVDMPEAIRSKFNEVSIKRHVPTLVILPHETL